jgi:hypothetical protein
VKATRFSEIFKDEKPSPEVPRPRHIAPQAATVVYQISGDDLHAVIRDAVAEALAELRASATSGPKLLDRKGIGTVLGVSACTVDRLRREGLPSVRVGDVDKYEPDACLEWLRSRKAGE